MSRTIHVASPVLRTSSAGTAFPPLFGVPGMAEWTERHHNRAPFWRRLLRSTARG